MDHDGMPDVEGAVVSAVKKAIISQVQYIVYIWYNQIDIDDMVLCWPRNTLS